MWVYHLGHEADKYLSTVTVFKGCYTLTFTGPVFSLQLSKSKVIVKVICQVVKYVHSLFQCR
jgi:hypothetical protein